MTSSRGEAAESGLYLQLQTALKLFSCLDSKTNLSRLVLYTMKHNKRSFLATCIQILGPPGFLHKFEKSFLCRNHNYFTVFLCYLDQQFCQCRKSAPGFVFQNQQNLFIPERHFGGGRLSVLNLGLAPLIRNSELTLGWLLLKHTRINGHAVERTHGWLRTRQVLYSLVQYCIFARPLLRRPKRLKDIVATQTASVPLIPIFFPLHVNVFFVG